MIARISALAIHATRINRTRASRSLSIAILVVLGVAPSQANSAFILTSGQPVYQVEAGGALDIPVYLTESVTNILATDGLSSAGLVLSFNLAPHASDPAQATLITPNPGMSEENDFIFTSIIPATIATPGAAELLFSLVLSDVLKPEIGSSSILLGTFHFVAGAIPGQVTNLALTISPGGLHLLHSW
jgi:hypothetical protein